MRKSEAIKLLSFGKPNVTLTAKHLGVTRNTVHRWPDELPQSLIDQVRGAHMRIIEEMDRQGVVAFGTNKKAP